MSSSSKNNIENDDQEPEERNTENIHQNEPISSPDNNNNNSNPDNLNEDADEFEEDDDNTPVSSAIYIREDNNNANSPNGDDENNNSKLDRTFDAAFDYFGLDPKAIFEMIERRSPALLEDFGGVDELFRCLRTDPLTGISPAEVPERQQSFGSNVLEKKEDPEFLEFFLRALFGKVVVILQLAALVSIILGLTVPDPFTNEVEYSTGWIEGVAIIISILVITLTVSINNYQKALQFRELEREHSVKDLFVLRGGHKVSIKSDQLVVGDVLFLEVGMLLSADGILTETSSIDLRVSEAAITGESDQIVKSLDSDFFILSGSCVDEGSAKMMVLGVGMNSFQGRVKKKSSDADDAETPLQRHLSVLADQIGYFGFGLAFVLISALCIKEGILIQTQDRPVVGANFLNFFLVAVTLIVVAIPEGLPLAVTIALAFSMRSMMKDHCLVRVLESCETMGAATAICSDKTGTLTTNEMTCVQGCVGGEEFIIDDYEITPRHKAVFVADRNNFKTKTHPGVQELFCQSLALNSTAGEEEIDGKVDWRGDKTEIGMLKLLALMKYDYKATRAMWNISNNSNRNNKMKQPFPRLDESTLAENTIINEEQKRVESSSSNSNENEENNNNSNREIKQFTFKAQTKRMSTVVREDDGSLTLHVKGASESILNDCSHYLDSNGDLAKMTKAIRAAFYDVIEDMSTQGNRTISVACRQQVQFPSFCYYHPTLKSSSSNNFNNNVASSSSMMMMSETTTGSDHQQERENNINNNRNRMPTQDPFLPIITQQQPDDHHQQNTTNDEKPKSNKNNNNIKLVFLGVVGMMDPVRLQVPQSINQAHSAGLVVRMCTGDNLATAVSIAKKCHIIYDNDNTFDMAMEGADFRKMLDADPEEFTRTCLPRLKVLARSTPQDKFTLVQLLQDQGEVVGVTGDGTNDAPALKLADVGFAMQSGTDIAKGSSDMILLDDNFATVITAIKWGRAVNDNVKKFLQFQLTINVTGVMLTLVASLASENSKEPFTPVQLLWLNLIMDTLAALSLATEHPEEASLDRNPVYKSASLISRRMWCFISFHSVWQFTLILVLLFVGHDWFDTIDKPETCQDNFDLIPKTVVNNSFTNSTAQYCENECTREGGVFDRETFRCQQGQVHSTLLFNVFIWSQIFNMINARKIHGEQNPLEGIFSRSKQLLFIFAVICGFQAMAVELFGRFMGTSGGLSGKHWGISIGIAAFSLLIGILQRLFVWFLSSFLEIDLDAVPEEVTERKEKLEMLKKEVLKEKRITIN